MSRVPLVLTTPISEFGEFTNSAEFNNATGMDRDMSYVPGFSDLRKARDVAIAEYVNHRGTREAIQALPVNVRWARNQKISGAPDSSKQFSHGNRGYRAATQKDIGEKWLTAMPPGAELGPDGTIRRGDTMLMVATAEQAARNEAVKRAETAKRVNGMEGAFAQQVASDRAGWKGADPTVTKEALSPIKAPVAVAAGK